MPLVIVYVFYISECHSAAYTWKIVSCSSSWKIYIFLELVFRHFGEKNGKRNAEEELKGYYSEEIGNLTVVINSFRILQIKGNLYGLLRCMLCTKNYITKFHV